MKKLFCFLALAILPSVCAFGQGLGSSGNSPLPMNSFCTYPSPTYPGTYTSMVCGTGNAASADVCMIQGGSGTTVVCETLGQTWYISTYSTNITNFSSITTPTFTCTGGCTPSSFNGYVATGEMVVVWPYYPPGETAPLVCGNCHTSGAGTSNGNNNNEDSCDDDNSCLMDLKTVAKGGLAYHQNTSAVYSSGSILGWISNVVFTQTDGSGNYSFTTTGYNNDTGQNPFITICPSCSSSSAITQTLGLTVSGSTVPVTFSLGQAINFQLPAVLGSFPGSIYLDGQTVVLGVQDYAMGGSGADPSCGASPVVCRVDHNPSAVDIGYPYFPSGSFPYGVVPLGWFYYYDGVFHYVTDSRPWSH